RENIAFYTPEASDAEIMKAIHVVSLDELVSELPEGLDTIIGQGKRVLSGGQAQRIALARAFLDKTRKVMLFDEPTAHLDI
ncbi:ATP-binding cassette domain-containing protein, partial [Klebsiella pneumoniae]